MKKWILAVIVVGVMIALAQKVKAAVVVTNITTSEFNTLTSSYEAAWSVLYRGGSIGSGTGVEEIRLARNLATPQANGGSNTLVGNLTWSPSNNSLEILIDEAGNISARANAVTVGTWGITRPYNQVLIRVFDSSFFGASDLQDTEINGDALRDMFANGSGGSNVQSDIVAVSNFGSQAPFSWNGVWGPGTNPNANEQYVWIVALQNTLVPEPSSLLLICFGSLFLLRRER
jgi:PEP-CTERM motif